MGTLERTKVETAAAIENAEFFIAADETPAEKISDLLAAIEHCLTAQWCAAIGWNSKAQASLLLAKIETVHANTLKGL